MASSKALLQQRLGELEQELLLRKSHEESLQQRLRLMEGQVELVHSKVEAAQVAEAEAMQVQGDVEKLRLKGERLQEQVEERKLIKGLLSGRWNEMSIYMYRFRSAGRGGPLYVVLGDAMYPEAYMSLELHDAHEFAWLTAPIRYPAAQDLHPR